MSDPELALDQRQCFYSVLCSKLYCSYFKSLQSICLIRPVVGVAVKHLRLDG